MPGGKEKRSAKSVNKNLVNKPFGFEQYSREKIDKMVTMIPGYSCGSEGSFLWGKFGKNEEEHKQKMDEMTSILHNNVFPKMVSSRESMVPFVVCALLAKGYTIDHIVENKVQKDAYDDIYNNIMDMQKPEKKEKALEWIYDSYTKGMLNATKKFGSRITDESIKNEDTWMSLTNYQLQSTLFTGGDAYFMANEDADFRKKVQESIERQNLRYNEEIYDIEKTFKSLEPMVQKFYPSSFISFAKVISKGEMDSKDLQDILSFYSLSNLDVKGLNFLEIRAACLGSADANHNNMFADNEVKEWFEKKLDEPNGKAFVYDCVKTGKFFNSMSIKDSNVEDIYNERKPNNPPIKVVHYSYGINANVIELDKAYNEFLIKKIIEKDIHENYIDSPEIEAVKELNDKYITASKCLEFIAAERYGKIHNLSVEYSGKENPTSEDYRRLENLTKVLAPLNDIANNNGNKISIRTLATDLHEDDFLSDYGNKEQDVKRPLAEDQPLTEEQKLQYKIMVKTILTANVTYRHCDIIDVSDYKLIGEMKSEIEKFKKSHAGYDELSSNELMDKFVEEQQNSIKALVENPICKKVYNNPDVTKTHDMIRDYFKDYMEQLKVTSKIEDGEMTGNTQLFTDMYNSIEKVVNYSKNHPVPRDSKEGLYKLLEDANEKIGNYIKERDTFIIFTQKGRDRVAIAKKLKNINDLFIDEYGKLNNTLIRNHQDTVEKVKLQVPEKELFKEEAPEKMKKEDILEKSREREDSKEYSSSENSFSF